MAGLGAFLSRAARRPWDWGEWDCCLWLAAWVHERTGVDGGEPFRGRYRTAIGCRRLLTRAGGVIGVVGHGAALAGLSGVEASQPGDIGVVRAMTSRGEADVGAIRARIGWAMLKPGGLLIAPAVVVKAWRVHG